MNKELIFLQTHIEYENIRTDLKVPRPLITIFGTTKDLLPIQVQVRDFIPFFYIQLSVEINVNDLQVFIQSHFKDGMCLGVEKCERMNIYGYQEKSKTFFKVFFNSPSVFKSAKIFFETLSAIGTMKVRCKIYESNFPYVLRFMNCLDITGMSYLRIENYEIECKDPFTISTSYKFIHQLPLEGEYRKLPNLKILSFDIECCGETSAFPSATRDPVIQIGNTIQHFGCTEMKKEIFCLKEVENIPNATVKWFDDERNLLLAWQKYVLEEDPDIIIGYNIKNFDFPYLLQRAEALKIKNFGKLGRTEKIAKSFKKTQSSSQFGSIEAFDTSIDGRIIYDLFLVLKRDFKLRSYSLNSVSAHFLGEQKEDVPYSSMFSLQNGDKESRRRIATYCLKDTVLPLRIFDHLNILINHSELARATYVPIEYFSSRGSAIKVLAQIYREANKYDYVIPDIDSQQQESSFEGAFVMDPIKGFYENPIAVLDFSSLYPSIMIAKNLCYTTLLSKTQYEKMKDDATVTPTQNYFLKPEKKQGLLPKILKDLIRTRKEVKAQIKVTKDEVLKKSLDGRQLALKICANSIYGFTGAPTGQLPCFEISQSTTGFGREMIAKTKKLIETNFSKSKNYSHDTQVIYGDTDSVMINFYENDIKKVFDMALHIASHVTSTFQKPIALEFEKVYFPYILMNKKRYAGLIYTNPEKPDRIDTKGIESVRRDNCKLVKGIMEECLDKILYKKDITGAVLCVKQKVKELYCDEIDLSQLIISKTYTKANYTAKSAHVELVEKLKKRGVDVRIGDRIPYVLVASDKSSKLYEKSEDPLYVLEKCLPIDVEYYIENQLKKPISRLFEPVLDNTNSLFQGEHIIDIKHNTQVTGPLNSFFIKKEQCIGCGANGTILCQNCKKDFPKYLIKLQTEYNAKAKRYHTCWRECQRCMGSVMNEILCVNTDCPIFYMRTKVKSEVENLKEKLVKIQKLEW